MRCPACGGDAEPDPAFAAHGLLRCARCSLLFAPPRDPEALRALYGEAYYAGYAHGEGYEEGGTREREAALRLALVRPYAASGRLLEVGCASGWFLAAAQAVGFSATGLEPSEAMAAAARERTGAEVLTGFLEDAPLPEGAFAVACLWHVLEHIPDPRGALERLAALLAPGGVVALEVPNAASRQAARLGDAWPHWDFPHHVAHWNPAALRRLFADWAVLRLDTLPGTAYQPFHPLHLKEALDLRALPRRPHRDRHELIRLVARRPAGASGGSGTS